MPNYKAVPLFGAVYDFDVYKRDRPMLIHIMDTDIDWNLGQAQALCKGPKPDSLMDDESVWEDPATATCKTCIKRYAKLIAK